MRTTRPLGLLALALGSGLLAWVLLDALERRGADPLPVPWTATAALLMLAGLVVVAAWEVRRWVGGRRKQPMSPLTAARIAVLAAASSYVGALLVGWYAAQAAVIVPVFVGERRERFTLALLAAAAALLLATAGVVGQRWCRRPPDSDPGHGDGLDGDDRGDQKELLE